MTNRAAETPFEATARDRALCRDEYGGLVRHCLRQTGDEQMARAVAAESLVRVLSRRSWPADPHRALRRTADILLRWPPTRAAVDVTAILDQAWRNRQRRRKRAVALVLTVVAIVAAAWLVLFIRIVAAPGESDCQFSAVLQPSGSPLNRSNVQ